MRKNKNKWPALLTEDRITDTIGVWNVEENRTHGMDECSDSDSGQYLFCQCYDSSLETGRREIVMSTDELTALIDLLTKYARISRQNGFSDQAEDALSLRDDRVRQSVVGR